MNQFEHEPGWAHDAQSDVTCAQSGCAHQAQLLQGGHSIVQADFLCDPAVLDPKHRRTREPHFPAGTGRKRAGEKIAKGGASVRAAALPTTDDVVALGDEIRRAVKLEIGERLAETAHERLDVRATTPRRMQ